jgi:hypothetical protein
MGEYAGQGVPQGTPEAQLVREVSAPLFKAKGWLKFLGVLMIIGGIVQAITIVGIIICWLPIWVGILLLKVASTTESAQMSGSKDELITAMSKLKTVFTIYGILALIGIVFAVIAMIVFGTTALLSGLSNF